MIVEAKRTCALHLTRVNGLHGATHDFRQICAGIERQRQRARNPNVHTVSDQLRHTKIEEERPYQNRRTTKHCNVNLGYAFQNLVFRHLHQTKSDTQNQRDRKRQQGDQQRVLQTGQQSRHRLFDKPQETDLLLSRIIGTIIGDLAGNRLDLLLRAGFAQILRNDRLIFARSDELVQTIVDGGQQIGVLAFIHGHTIFAMRHLRCYDFQTVILGNTVGKHRIVVKYRVRIAGFDHLVHG